VSADVVIIGAGAAGMMCAIEAGKRGRRVLLLEHAEKLGEKIRISGGGRCNFTNIATRPENFLSANPDFCRSALARYTPRDFIALVEKHGISVDAVVSCNGASFRENLLVTHRGLSGPAILQISSYWRPGLDLSVNLLPDLDPGTMLEAMQTSEKLLANVLGEFLPQRFAQRWVEIHFENQPMKRLGATRLRAIAERLRDWRIRPSGTVGYRKAEVTLGGVDTRELSSRTMEARKVPGLYFVGEVVDVTGHLGGYNFQWAWASGHAAGQAV
jgi:predicted flavoprotein YhiN